MRYDYLRSADTKSGATTSFSLLEVPFDVVANIPIGFLDVRGETRSIVVDNPLKSSGKKICKLKTLGELAAFGYEKLNRIIRTGYYPQKSFSQIMYEIQVALARFSMKLRGTDFTIFDIKIDDLKLSDEAKSFVRKQGATELGDLYIDYKTMSRLCSTRVRDSIREALLEFGSRPEVSGSLSLTVMQKEKENLESTIRNARERVFPNITKFAQYSVSEPLSKMDWVSGKQYSGAECDYSGLVKEFLFEFLTEDDIVLQTGIDAADLENIKNGKVLSINVFAKLCKYFDADIDSLVAFNDESKRITKAQISEFLGIKQQVRENVEKPALSASALTAPTAEVVPAEESSEEVQEDESEILEPTSLEMAAYDYSPLFKKIDKIASLASFSKMYNISYGTIRKMQQGKPVSYRVIERIANILGCMPNELYVADRKKIEEASAGWLKLEQERNKSKEYDYTGLKLKLAERLMNVSQLCDILNFKSYVKIYISGGVKISDENLRKIEEFLGCGAEEIVSRNLSYMKAESSRPVREVPQIPPQSEIERDVMYDYSGLFNLMKQRRVTKQMLAKDARVHGYIFTYQINKGLPISKMYLARLCLYFKCREEDLITRRYAPVSEEPQSHVNLGYGSGLARVKPYSPLAETEETTKAGHKPNSTGGGAGSGSGSGVKPKFYMGRNGFLNQEHGLIKLHRESHVSDMELDFIERQF